METIAITFEKIEELLKLEQKYEKLKKDHELAVMEKQHWFRLYQATKNTNELLSTDVIKDSTNEIQSLKKEREEALKEKEYWYSSCVKMREDRDHWQQLYGEADDKIQELKDDAYINLERDHKEALNKLKILEPKIKNQKTEIKNLAEALRLEKQYRRDDHGNYRIYKKKLQDKFNCMHAQIKKLQECRECLGSGKKTYLEDCWWCKGTGQDKAWSERANAALRATEAKEEQDLCKCCKGAGRLGGTFKTLGGRIVERDISCPRCNGAKVELKNFNAGEEFKVENKSNVEMKLTGFPKPEQKTVNGVPVDCLCCRGTGIWADDICAICNGTGKNSQFLNLPARDILGNYKTISHYTVEKLININETHLRSLFYQFYLKSWSESESRMMANDVVDEIKIKLGKYGLKLKE